MIPQLRDYQQRAIVMLYSWLARNAGNPCIVAPTGSGKSWIIAALCEDILRQWPDSRILILSHVKELLSQDADKIVQAWPDAPVGLYSAGLNHRDVDRITVAGIQSVWRRPKELGKVDLAIVDEAHLINHSDSGMYRSLLKDLKERNPLLRIVGLTATPYRLGHGLITEGENRIFDGLIEPVTIAELVAGGSLAPLRSKLPAKTLDVEGVHKRGGEYVESELQLAVDTDANNAEIVRETISRAGDRKAWLFFCTGVEHAFHMRDELRQAGIPTATVVGDTPAAERAEILENFKSGQLKALTNVDVLTTGFDYPGIDLLAMCRPTLSPGLYVQMAGRGMRVAEGKADCLVLDFAGNVAAHGPITSVAIPKRKRAAEKKPVRKCPECDEIVAANAKICPACGYEFPAPERKPQIMALHGRDDIMGIEPSEMELRGWFWSVQHSSRNGLPMLRVDYDSRDFVRSISVSEYLCLMHGGFAEQKGFKTLRYLMRCSGIAARYPDAMTLGVIKNEDELRELAQLMNEESRSPAKVYCVREGKYYRVVSREWKVVEANGDAAAELGPDGAGEAPAAGSAG
ncbi:DEAD/DEAH box helicase [Pyramidobacter sp. CG50-2]|uniref:DEAD/DEAH box helicase n=1 Tax=Pyramidobacter sp. CG50-2 TaxID=2382160 RepID=UPI000EA11251|nr:DEAD/DEAH box helicase [Pyramidobacter sp. CG50-2]RKJ78819.1 DEAD/DEAH box helicase [Pyramidobacter sp. CG50-2]